MNLNSRSVTVKKYIFSKPDAEIHIYSNAVIVNQKMYIPAFLKKPCKLPTMYAGWIHQQSSHVEVKRKFRKVKNVNYNEKNLLIFDTWGSSSYYHLLIDHIIPLWITREWHKEKFNCEDQDFEFFRVSKNSYPREISAANEIFSHFFGKSFIEQVSGQFERITYGYLFSYRPFHGPKKEFNLYPDYAKYLEKFRKTHLEDYCLSLKPQIIVPIRKDRDFEFVHKFIALCKDSYNFLYIDFSEMSVQEQIRICGTARVMFGSEGAAFANQVFMPEKSLIIPVSNQSDRFGFHSSLAKYLDFTFLPVLLGENGHSTLSEEEILETLNKHCGESQT